MCKFGRQEALWISKISPPILEISHTRLPSFHPFHPFGAPSSIADFMVQGGDPTGTGRGGTSIYGHPFADELTPALRFTGAGILAMANSGPNTNGSQFFLTLAPTPFLDRKHTIFGRVSDGLGVVQRLGSVGVDEQDRPREEVKILKAVAVPAEAESEAS
ncbi:Peptidyl-prolyl cis-trans isomerase-like 1 [Tilletia horrida]|nr:Peptidyl-prolyl cis-trans isomerase-like 1 [Tilletia horrida]